MASRESLSRIEVRRVGADEGGEADARKGHADDPRTRSRNGLGKHHYFQSRDKARLEFFSSFPSLAYMQSASPSSPCIPILFNGHSTTSGFSDGDGTLELSANASSSAYLTNLPTHFPKIERIRRRNFKDRRGQKSGARETVRPRTEELPGSARASTSRQDSPLPSSHSTSNCDNEQFDILLVVPSAPFRSSEYSSLRTSSKAATRPRIAPPCETRRIWADEEGGEREEGGSGPQGGRIISQKEKSRAWSAAVGSIVEGSPSPICLPFPSRIRYTLATMFNSPEEEYWTNLQITQELSARRAQRRIPVVSSGS